MSARRAILHFAPGDPLQTVDLPGLDQVVAAGGIWKDGPNRHLRVVDADGAIAATASIWSQTGATLDASSGGGRIGMIGHFGAIDASATAHILDEACDLLRSAGCDVAVGPIDGSTWRRYRFAVEPAASDATQIVERPFLMEPRNPAEWPGWWRSAGFEICATYHSSACTIDDEIDATGAAERPRGAGLTLRPLRTGAHAPTDSETDTELRRVHALCEAAFPDNLLYTPLSWAEFAAMYAPLLPRLAPGMVLLADEPTRPDELAGFIMCVPDSSAASASPGARPDTLILKSMAVHPRWRRCGLGAWLIAAAIENGRRLGLRRVIFALMRDDNPSARIGRHYARVMRRYELLQRGLDA